jgi:type II secretory ATPase GspE/PulE/Tfp pilus assembly ATPase PilB-like protein/tetratricopeptide (TPR) repeat protein
MTQRATSNADNRAIKIKEADTCHAMGLLNEALSIYEGLFSDIDEKDVETKQSFGEKIKSLKSEIEKLEESAEAVLPSAEKAVVSENVKIDEDSPSTLEEISALKERGLFDQAVSKYEKIIDQNFDELDFSKIDTSLKDLLSDYLACLIEISPAKPVIEKANKLILTQKLNPEQTAQIKFALGLELEKRNDIDLAIDLFAAASNIDPSNKQIIEKLKSSEKSISSNSRYDYLIKLNLVTTEQLQDALTISKKKNKSVEFVLIDQFKIDRKDVGKSLELFYDCTFKSFDEEIPIPFELINKLKKPFLRNNMWVPLSWSKNGIEVLIDDPKDLQKTDYVRALLGNQKIIFNIGIKEEIQQFIEYFFDPKSEKTSDETIDEYDDYIPDVSFEEEEEVEEDIADIDETSSQVVKFVDQVLITAFRNNVSDIHVEPSPVTRKTIIRFRTDGVCHEYIQVPNSMAPAVISRLKIMADLDIAEKRLPQDGKIKIKRKGIPEFELRMSTMPTAGRFEDAVLRILTRTGEIKLDDIGLNKRNLEVLKRIIHRPYGMILCVGPTGSGKTTTLHSALAYINHPEIKIWTAEDPVEITQSGLRQVQVKPKIGLDFARVMRGFLRLDPDVIMIGEMRDKETASIAIEASLTGHLVLSTLHTNNAPETLTRLLDMGMNPLNISDAFLGVLAQRLVRRQCKDCIESYQPTEEEFEDIRSDYGKDAFAKFGYKYSPEFKLYRSLGCERCNESGYRGRMGIHELIEGTPEIKKLIKQQATSHDLAKQATKDGMTTLKQDGIHKVIDGVTDIAEVRRVCVT